MRQFLLKTMLIFGFFMGVVVFFSGCISPKTDAFLLGAGIGAGVTAYFMEGGSIGGYTLRSFAQAGNASQTLSDSSIPADLEWYYLERQILSDIQLSK